MTSKPAADHAVVAARWDGPKRAAFDAMAPAALVLVATDGPVSVTLWGPQGAVRRFGHNRGVWPAKIVRSASWKDNVTPTHDKSPFFWMGGKFRFWCLTGVARDRLAAAVVDLIASRVERDGGLDELLHGYRDLGPDLDLAMFELEVWDIARRVGVQAWDDAGLSAFLDRVVASVLTREGQGRGHRRASDAYEAAAMKLLEKG